MFLALPENSLFNLLARPDLTRAEAMEIYTAETARAAATAQTASNSNAVQQVAKPASLLGTHDKSTTPAVQEQERTVAVQAERADNITSLVAEQQHTLASEAEHAVEDEKSDSDKAVQDRTPNRFWFKCRYGCTGEKSVRKTAILLRSHMLHVHNLLRK